MGPGVKRLTIGNIDNFITEQPLLVYRDCLLMLANTHTVQLCTMSDCKSLVDLKTETIGSAFYITWVKFLQHFCIYKSKLNTTIKPIPVEN